MFASRKIRRKRSAPSLLNHLRPLRNSKLITGLEPGPQDDDPILHATIRSPWPGGYQRPLETLEDYQRLLAESKTVAVRNTETTSNDEEETTTTTTEPSEAHTTVVDDNDDVSHQTFEVMSNYLTNNLELSDVESNWSTDSKKEKPKPKLENEPKLGSIFEHIGALPTASSVFQTIQPTLSSSTTTTDVEILEANNEDLYTLQEQRNKNFQLLRNWTDEGRYSRLKAMTIASTLYNSKVTEAEIRGELTAKEKFAYKKFCWELDDKLGMGTKGETLSERTLRKVWHLYALYTKALSDEIWDEGNAKSDITSRAIAYLVKRAMTGPDFDPAAKVFSGSNWTKTELTPEEKTSLKPVEPIESMNPILAKCLNDPIHGFLVVYGRFVATGKINNVDKLRKLNFNNIAEDFFEKTIDPPVDAEIEALLLKHHNGYRRYRSRANLLMNSLCPPSSRKLHTGDKEGGDGGASATNNNNNQPAANRATPVIRPPQLTPKQLQQLATTTANGLNAADVKSLQRKLQMIDGKKRICLVGCRYDVLPQVAKEVGFEVVGENDLWNINWSDSPLAQEKIMEMRRIQDTHSVFWGLNAPLQKTNHFPGMYEICRKDRLCRNLNRLKKMFPNDYNFFPPTWDLPTEQADLLAYSRKRKNLTFIVKPESGCQGKGIFLIRNLKNLYPFAKCVCQLYVPHPFLLDGYKFDQRIYVLITCVDPLRLYIYDEGIARFATVKYGVPTDDNLEVVYMHLTNYSLNKFSESYVPEGDGSKRKMSTIYQWMEDNGYDVAKLTKAIDEIVVKTILCAAPTLRHNYKTSFPKRDRGCSCFELLGFDILVDRHLKPLLLEVNHSPSFNLDLAVDAEVKSELLKDLLNMVYLGDEINAQAQSIQKRKGRASKRDPSPSEANVPDINGLPRALARQFHHETLHRGKFRLIYSSDKPGKYTKLVEENYCGYNTAECGGGGNCQVAKKRTNNIVVFPDDDDDYDLWAPRETTSTVKMTKQGQMYVETRIVPSHGPSSQLQKYREVPDSEISVGNSRRKGSTSQSRNKVDEAIKSILQRSCSQSTSPRTKSTRGRDSSRHKNLI